MRQSISIAILAALATIATAYPASVTPSQAQITSTPTVKSLKEPRMNEDIKALESFAFIDQISLSIAPTPVTERLRNHIFLVEEAQAMGDRMRPVLPSDEAFQEGYKDWVLEQRNERVADPPKPFIMPEDRGAEEYDPFSCPVKSDCIPDQPKEYNPDCSIKHFSDTVPHYRRDVVPDGRKPAGFPWYTFWEHTIDHPDSVEAYGGNCVNDLASSAKVGRDVKEDEDLTLSVDLPDIDVQHDDEEDEHEKRGKVYETPVSWTAGAKPQPLPLLYTLGADGDVEAHEHPDRQFEWSEEEDYHLVGAKRRMGPPSAKHLYKKPKKLGEREVADHQDPRDKPSDGDANHIVGMKRLKGPPSAKHLYKKPKTLDERDAKLPILEDITPSEREAMFSVEQIELLTKGGDIKCPEKQHALHKKPQAKQGEEAADQDVQTAMLMHASKEHISHTKPKRKFREEEAERPSKPVDTKRGSDFHLQLKYKEASKSESDMAKRGDGKVTNWDRVQDSYWTQRWDINRGWEPEMADGGYNVWNEDRGAI